MSMDVFAALADPTRRRVLDAVATAGAATATELAAQFPVSRQAVVKHLAVLHDAGLVQSVKQGREVRYSVAPTRVEAVADALRARAAGWDARLGVLANLVEARPLPPPQLLCALCSVDDLAAAEAEWIEFGLAVLGRDESCVLLGGTAPAVLITVDDAERGFGPGPVFSVDSTVMSTREWLTPLRETVLGRYGVARGPSGRPLRLATPAQAL